MTKLRSHYVDARRNRAVGAYFAVSSRAIRAIIRTYGEDARRGVTSRERHGAERSGDESETVGRRPDETRET